MGPMTAPLDPSGRAPDPHGLAPAPPAPPVRLRGGLDARMLTALVGVATFGALFAAGAGMFFGGRAALSVGVGALVAVLNLYGLARILGAMVGARADGDPDGAGGTSGIWGILAVAKVLVLFGGVWWLMGANLVDPMPLVVGWGALPIGIALGSILSDKSPRSHAKEAPPPSVE
jgi:hypothetical protein